MRQPMKQPAGGMPQPGGQGMPAGQPQPSQQQPAQRPPRQGLNGNPAAGSGEGPKATPEQQEEYNKFVLLATNMIFDERLEEAALKAMQTEKDPVRAVSKLAALVASRVYIGAAEQGSDISWPVLLHGGWEIVQQAAEFAAMNGIAELGQEDMEMAYLMAVDQFRLTLEQAGMLDRIPIKDGVREMEQAMGPDTLRQMQEAANKDRIPRNALMPKGAQQPRPGGARAQQPPQGGRPAPGQGAAPGRPAQPQRPGRGLGAAAGMV